MKGVSNELAKKFVKKAKEASKETGIKLIGIKKS